MAVLQALLKKEYDNLLPKNAITLEDGQVMITIEEGTQYIVEEGWTTIQIGDETQTKKKWETMEAFFNEVSPKWRQRFQTRLMEKLAIVQKEQDDQMTEAES